ncbi:chaperonin containing TCP1, group II (cytosolic) [Monocercomonoides exilis]|uniref:chaperonin containing TCP1, group II (cytosolic) n=1 Tax=Monocercomonoides exilis TaxID=2049356 RepID=UPI003559E338|nr:chaperonin containing TCP1, group II (cytosolic) [Monocercomonoides exilis]|eukprot:MONOS_13243.1-p1 / transcript=MONOS_13243.1 / gene=MONOS_13243 / organism=Monocercomonoides_exilis_PA203 / gene_product=chaperonin containing TCP1, group II (cytosolic) / transcript_product=chaperonin containing TCP1, group II (cytosolic) / location=Mono_scaffold00796:19490-21639(-) / protein_length=518 / sequence_SO=supercontig / SO=protein_coding / is_pseudo=false
METALNKALSWNISQAKGLQEVLKSNIGPHGTMKMLVSGGGDIKITKDGSTLLSEMQIQLPTAQLISRSAAAIDDEYGDGTSSVCLLTAEILKLAEKYIIEGTHPRILVDGIKKGCEIAVSALDEIKLPVKDDQKLIEGVVRSSFMTKVPPLLAARMTEITTEAIKIIQRPEQELNLHMIEIMHMQHKMAAETSLVRGLVLDHGGRHPDMPKELENCFILTCNVSLEYEKTEVNSTMAYASPEQRERMVEAERRITDDNVRKIIDLKRRVCTDDQSFVVINQKGIDPLSLDMFAKEGILALRRAKKRNMERLALACGGVSVNAVDDLDSRVLGWAGHVYEQKLGEDKYTFVEDCKHPMSCTILVKGPTPHVIAQMKDALRDGLRAAKNAIKDGYVVPGAGAFEIAASEKVLNAAVEASGKITAGMTLFGESLLLIPKLIALNSGFDALESVSQLQQCYRDGLLTGIDVDTGEPCDPATEGIFDNLSVKRQIVLSASVIGTQLLMVDDVLAAGKPGAT